MHIYVCIKGDSQSQNCHQISNGEQQQNRSISLERSVMILTEGVSFGMMIALTTIIAPNIVEMATTNCVRRGVTRHAGLAID